LALPEALRKAKITPLALFLVLVGVVAIAYVALGTSFVRQQWDQDALSSQIDLAQGVLAAASGSQQTVDDLEARLSAAKKELALAQSTFPSELDSKNIVERVLAYASQSQVRVLQVQTEPSATDGNETGAHSVFSFKFDVAGGFDQLVAFAAALDGGALGVSKTGAFSLRQEGGGYVLSLEVLTYARSPVDEASAPEAPEGPPAAATETAGDVGAAPSE
jgi:hypothetical protein